jgi:hypothetical protein
MVYQYSGEEIKCTFLSGYEEAKEDHTFAVWAFRMFGDDSKNQNCVHEDSTNR